MISQWSLYGKGRLIANAAAAAMCIIINCRFSSSYFSYALILFILFLLYDWYTTKHAGGTFSLGTAGLKKMAVGIVVFYGTLFLSSILLQDGQSIHKSADYAALSLPFFMFGMVRSRHVVDTGFKWGLIISSVVICGIALKVWIAAPQTRMVSLFEHPNHLGTGIAMLFPFMVYYFIREKRMSLKCILFVLMGAQLFCLYHTASRGAIAGLTGGIAAAAVVMGIQYRKKIGKKLLAACVVGMMIILTTGAVLFGSLQQERSGIAKTGGERILMLEASYEMWKDHPLLGVGVARWQENYYSDAYHPAQAKELTTNMPHNMPVMFFSSTGLLGGFGYLFFVAASFAALYQAASKSKDPLLSVAAIAAFFAFTIHGMVDTTIINKVPARIYYCLMGYFVAAAWGADVTQRISEVSASWEKKFRD